MKLIVNKENLQRALGFVERATSKNASLPILNNILLKTENGQLRLSATNLEVGVSSAIGAKIDKEGEIAVPGRILSDFVRAARHDIIELTTKQNTLSVDAGPFTTSILGFDAAEYPLIPKINRDEQRSISTDVLRRMLAGVMDSIAVSDSRPELAGALMNFESEATVLAATDSFRLVEQRAPAQNKRVMSVIIPRVAIMELAKALSGVTGDISIAIADNQISFLHDDFEIISRLVDGKYPDYRKVIPERSLVKVLVRKDELEDAIKVAALFSSTISDIKMECRDNTIQINAKNASKGEAQATIEANIKGDPFDIAMNYHYLLDGLKVMNSDKVILEFTGNGSPFVLRPSDDAVSSVYVIMPLRN